MCRLVLGGGWGGGSYEVPFEEYIYMMLYDRFFVVKNSNLVVLPCKRQHNITQYCFGFYRSKDVFTKLFLLYCGGIGLLSTTKHISWFSY